MFASDLEDVGNPKTGGVSAPKKVRARPTLSEQVLLGRNTWRGCPPTGEPWQDREESANDNDRLAFWVPVLGYEAEYAICPFGYLKSLARHTQPRNHSVAVWLNESLVLPVKVGKYWVVSLSRGGRQKMAYIHKLLAEAFFEPCPEGHLLRKTEEFEVTHHIKDLFFQKRLSRLRPIETAAERAKQKLLSRHRIEARRKKEREDELRRLANHNKNVSRIIGRG